MRKILILAALASLVLCGCTPREQSASSPLPPNGSIAYDSQCYTIDGKPTFLFSGSFHYFRCPKALWADRFEKMKQAGLNCVETYVAWNWHERQPPATVDDFAQMDMTDLTDWLDMAINRFGFYVILRPGPYICAEWDGGGYPQWLITKKPAGAKSPWYRSDDPAYLAWCRHWFAAAAKTAAPWQVTHRPAGHGGVILWQIENEYNYFAAPAQEKLNQLVALAHDSRDFGIDVPLITCMTDDHLYRQDEFLRNNVIECSNTYPGFNPRSEVRNLGRLDTYQPDRPRLVTELQGGWFSDVGKQLSQDMGFTPAQITHVTLLAWAMGYTGTNYYMMFGGTNFGDWGAASRTTSYDYAAPIREWGGVGPRYLAVAAMGKMIQQHGAKLLRAVAEQITMNPPPSEELTVMMRRATDGSRYLFVLNNSKDDPASGELHVATVDGAGQWDVPYQLDPFDAKVLYLPPGATAASQGQWLPEPLSPPQRPTQIPAEVQITSARRQLDPGPVEDSWRPLPAGGGVEDVGIFDRRFVYYRTTVPPQSESASLALIGELPSWAGTLLAQINGNRLKVEPCGLGSLAADLPRSSTGGDLLVLYENAGRVNNGVDMERKCGPADLRITVGGFLPQSLERWRIHAVVGDPAPMTAVDFDDTSWKTASASDRSNRVAAGTTAVFRTNLDLTSAQLKAGAGTLMFGQISGKHQLYVNGQPIDESGRDKFEAAAALKPGRNVIALVVSAGRSAGGIGPGAQIVSSVEIPTAPVQWQVSGQTAGVAGQWWQPALDDSSWAAATIGGEVDKADPPSVALFWYRMHFQLPAPDPHVWVPWKLHLSAAGNGFIYLNGHALGRWWEAGPQYDFFLPECWLNSGPGADNVLTLCLRPTSGPTAIHAASVGPYADFAEAR